MTGEVSFFIEGNPIPQGSKVVARGGGKTWLRDANASRLKPWRHVVAIAADIGVTFDTPVTVTLSFVLPKTQRPKWWAPAGRVGDLDKLTRACLDGLVDGGLLADDSLVITLHATKRYPNPGDPCGVGVDINEHKENQ